MIDMSKVNNILIFGQTIRSVYYKSMQDFIKGVTIIMYPKKKNK